MTQLHRGMGGTAPQPTHLRRTYPRQSERRLVGYRLPGALKVGRVARDGTKIKANASTHKAMS